jgi:ketosteroid isomerase-like protein
MPAEDVELVGRAFVAFARRDIELLLGLCHPEVEIRSLMTEAERTLYRGHQGVREWLAAVLDVFPDWRPRLHEARDLGGAVVSSFDVTATAAISGAPIDQRYWQAARVRDGKIVWVGFFRTEEDAVEALGLGD